MMMTAEQAAEAARGLTFEKVWAALMESRERQEKSFAEVKESFAEIKEALAETDRIQKRTALQMEETDRRLAKFGDRQGEIIERMVMPNLIAKFHELGFVFTKMSPYTVIKDEQNQIATEIDITLENGDKVMIVEVKTKPTTQDIKEHIKRMEKVRRHAALRADERKYLGAVAGMVFNDNEKTYAHKNGFYVIEPSGDTFNIIEPSGGYRPREW